MAEVTLRMKQSVFPFITEVQIKTQMAKHYRTNQKKLVYKHKEYRDLYGSEWFDKYKNYVNSMQ